MNYKELYIVGIGASAGGFEALQKFLSKIQMDDNISYVITQHLDAKRPTLLGELLSKFSGFQISAIKDGQNIEGNHIYYCPENKNLEIKDGKFLFSNIENKHFPKPSINNFFESLAQEKKEKAIGIILSGTGTDGTEGIVAIANAGGITLTEDEGAKYYSMPKSSIDSGKVIASLPPEMLADGILNIIKDRKYFEKHFEIEDHIEKIFNILKEETSIDFSSYKHATVERRIKKRIIEKKADGVDEYIKILLSDDEEVSKLKDELLIVVTSFFRDEEAFLELKIHLTELIRKKLDNHIRIWITACATGEEAYSMAILISEIFEELNITKKVTIFATDISDKVITESRNRIFRIEELDGVPPALLNKYFENTNKQYKIVKKIRDMIVFSKHDIIKDPPFLNLDMISCRNLLIYFNTELQKRILSIFYYSLRYESILFLGKSETIGTLTSLFSIVDNKSKIYKKLNDLTKIDIETLAYDKRNSTFVKNKYQNNQNQNLMDIEFTINKAISERYIQNGIVVDNNYNILFYKGNCKEFLQHPQGVHTNDLFRLIVDFLRLDVRATINESKKSNIFVSSKKIRVLPISEPKEYVIINVYPLEKNKLGENTYFVSFDKITDIESSINNDSFDPIDLNDSDLGVLEDELLTLKERLQITIEELETSNEELQSTNEELQSTNEELQSTNEELETSNEELQSTNEELQAVNDELNSSNLKLDFANNAFNNVLSNLGAYVVILDNSLNIIKYTEGIVKFFDLSKNKDNNFSTALLNSNIELPNLLENIKDCLRLGTETAYEIEYENRNYYFSIKRINLSMLHDKDNNKAIILSFIDKTEYIEQDRLIFQQAKLVSMGEMISNISHQWRQPLSMITTVASGLKLKSELENIDIDFITENMDIILSQAKYLSETIDNFRNFIKEKREFSNTTITKVIDETLNLVEASLKNNFISIVIDAKKDIEIDASTNELVEALINLINNSKDALIENVKDDSDRFIFITTNLISNDSIELKITDTAGGINEKIINRVLEPYFTTKHESLGTGLGLAMVDKIVRERHNGKIEIFNEEFEYNSKTYKGVSFSLIFKAKS
ncbi:MAG: CheR family methyltransferase [Halarcobacter sp.]